MNTFEQLKKLDKTEVQNLLVDFCRQPLSIVMSRDTTNLEARKALANVLDNCLDEQEVRTLIYCVSHNIGDPQIARKASASSKGWKEFWSTV